MMTKFRVDSYEAFAFAHDPFAASATQTNLIHELIYNQPNCIFSNVKKKGGSFLIAQIKYVIILFSFRWTTDYHRAKLLKLHRSLHFRYSESWAHSCANKICLNQANGKKIRPRAHTIKSLPFMLPLCVETTNAIMATESK